MALLHCSIVVYIARVSAVALNDSRRNQTDDVQRNAGVASSTRAESISGSAHLLRRHADEARDDFAPTSNTVWLRRHVEQTGRIIASASSIGTHRSMPGVTHHSTARFDSHGTVAATMDPSLLQTELMERSALPGTAIALAAKREDGGSAELAVVLIIAGVGAILFFLMVTGQCGVGSSVRSNAAAAETGDASVLGNDTCMWKYNRGGLSFLNPFAWSKVLTFDEAISQLGSASGEVVLRVTNREYTFPTSQEAVGRLRAIILGRGMPAFTFDHRPGKFPEKVAAIAFGGGGFKSVVGFWVVLYHLSKTQNIEQLFRDNHFGVSSGGGWMFVAVIYSRLMWKSITSGMDDAEFLRTMRSYMEAVKKKLESNKKPLGPLTGKGLTALLGNPRLKDILEAQGFPLFDQQMLESVNYFVNSPNGWKPLNDVLMHDASDTPNAGLNCTCDLAHGLLANVTLGFDDNIVVDRATVYQIKNEGKPLRWTQIPMTINARVSPEKMVHTATLCQKEQTFEVDLFSETRLGCCCLWDLFSVNVWRRARQVKVTKDDIERGFQNILAKPLDLSGPTSCYLAVFSSQFFTSYMSGGIFLEEILENLERKVILDTFYAVDACSANGEKICPLRMVDGGPWDHTGIAMSVRGMQREGREGALVALNLYALESYVNFLVMFQDYDNRGDHDGQAQPPYPRLFKGFPPTSVAKYGEYAEVVDSEVETVDCPEFEIKGGHRFRLFVIFMDPAKMKLLPFNQESVEEYMEWSEQALKDLALWASNV